MRYLVASELHFSASSCPRRLASAACAHVERLPSGWLSIKYSLALQHFTGLDLEHINLRAVLCCRNAKDSSLSQFSCSDHV